MIITTEQKYELIAARVTLDGKPAKISGTRQQFATVATIDPNGPAVEFSWPAVARIVATGGKFKA
jgi:hypothetical protein